MNDIDTIQKYRSLTHASEDMGIEITRLRRIRKGIGKPATKDELRILKEYASKLKFNGVVVDRDKEKNRRQSGRPSDARLFKEVLSRPFI